MDLCITVAKYVAMTTSIQPFCYPSIQRCIHPSIKLYTHPIDYSTIIHASDWLFIHPSIQSIVHPSINLTIRQFIQPYINSIIDPINPVHTFIQLSIHPFDYPSIIHASNQLVIHPSIWSGHPFDYSSIPAYIHLIIDPLDPVHLSIQLSIYTFDHPSVRPCMHASIQQSIHMIIHPSAYPFNHPSIPSTMLPYIQTSIHLTILSSILSQQQQLKGILSLRLHLTFHCYYCVIPHQCPSVLHCVQSYRV